jgi:4-hydroxy-3-methylbut-2-enyl diphosphate reductase
MGVQRALDQVNELLQTGKTIYTYGSIANNEVVVEDLRQKGVSILHSRSELMELSQGTVIIRSHGVSKDIYEVLRAKKLEYVDATCPFVKKVHRVVTTAREKGDHILIVGNPEHPEVEGTIGWCEGAVDVLETPEEAYAYEPPKGVTICVVAQTTFNYKKFHHMVDILKEKGYNGYVVNTICNATEERQSEAQELAAKADVMIVIGGKHSSNTRKLYEICSGECAKTYFIQTVDDLHLELTKDVLLVGITAGASTPNKIIEEVQNYVRQNF